MKTLFTLLFSFLAFLVSAQDTLIFQNGDEISVKVLEVGIHEIKYKKWDNVEGPLYVNNKSEIFAIKFQNGSVEVFKEQRKPSVNPNLNYNEKVSQLEGMSQEEKYLKGRMDAKSYYKGNSAMWGTSVITFLFPPAGIVVGTVAALTPPQKHNLNAPDQQLLKDNQYHLGYKKQAQSKKAGKTLAGFTIGIGAVIILYAIIPPQ